jgi:hypothetical protein
MAKTTLSFLFVVLLTIGCGGGKKAAGDPEMQRREDELKQIRDMYLMYMKANQRPPKQLSDLNQKQFEAANPAGFHALQRGQYIVVWGVDINNNAGAVLVYEKDAPTKGGAVLLADSTFKMMSADELKAAAPTLKK